MREKFMITTNISSSPWPYESILYGHGHVVVENMK